MVEKICFQCGKKFNVFPYRKDEIEKMKQNFVLVNVVHYGKQREVLIYHLHEQVSHHGIKERQYQVIWVFKKEKIIPVGMVELPIRIKLLKVLQNLKYGVKKFLKEIILYVSFVRKKVVNYIQTILNVLRIILNLDLQLVMVERYVFLAIRKHQRMVIINTK